MSEIPGALHSNVITLGDGNVVNARFENLHVALDQLKEAVGGTADLGEAEKLDLFADIESIKDQLAKSAPNKGVLRALWSGLERIATLETVTQAYERVQALILPLM